MAEKIVLLTVADLIATLQRFPQETKVLLFSDAEGNDVNPLAYIGDYEGADGEKRIVLVPMHHGWERYV